MLSSSPATMVSFKYWDECVDPEDLEAMWNRPAVRKEWTDVGETQGQKVHLSRDPDGQPYLTQTEMRAVAEIVTSRHFDTHIEPIELSKVLDFSFELPIHREMISAIAELESNRQPLAMQYDKKAKVTTVGIMQICPTTAEWLVRECHVSLYKVEEDLDILYRPFVNVYFGAMYLKWLSNFENKVRTEEFIIRAYKGGTKKATHKSTLPYWKRYLSVKETFTPRYRKHSDAPPITQALNSTAAPVSLDSEDGCLYWDSRVSPEDMKQMWNCPEICNEWNKADQKGEKCSLPLTMRRNHILLDSN
ncbi:Glyceraldehyde-3-phosphate dehydrogenase of plastid 2 isoform 1 [Hibiscus syriacus]|uniref:Glyceraldehyde-3-phosphate dehydrogenase of plastid 2 isoform 1 n=1 Tax=Hibiscus syriacus TaxID=106335 RepID=A0A6A3ARE9_HIBSY|nr:Glyceraldehyde-3-phosphate dehydrogenase of plastid 2 isoform 1 [Hibiscus syriacus]